MATALSRDRKHYYVRFKLLMGLERATVCPTKGSMGNEWAHSGIILTPGMKIIQTKSKSVIMPQDCLALSASVGFHTSLWERRRQRRSHITSHTTPSVAQFT